MQSEAPPIIRRQYSRFYRRWAQIILYKNRSSPRLLAAQLGRSEYPILWLRVCGLGVPVFHDVRQSQPHRHWLTAGFGLRFSNASVQPSAPDVDSLVLEIQILPLQSQTLADPESSRCGQKRQRALKGRKGLCETKRLLRREDHRLVVARRLTPDPLHRIGILGTRDQTVTLGVLVHANHDGTYLGAGRIS